MADTRSNFTFDPARRAIAIQTVVVLFATFVPSLMNQFPLVDARLRASHDTEASLLHRMYRDLGGVLLILYCAYWVSPNTSLPKLSFKWMSDLGIGVVLFVIARGISWGLDTLVSGRPDSIGIAIRPWSSSVGMLVLLALVMALSALFQELLVRWFLMLRLEQLGVPIWSAMVISSVLFASWHFYEGEFAVVAMLIYGALYGTSFALNRRLAPLIIAHFLWNFILCLQIGHP